MNFLFMAAGAAQAHGPKRPALMLERDAPDRVHVDPGKTGEISWAFKRAVSFPCAGLIAGHHPAGMLGTLTVKAKGV